MSYSYIHTEKNSKIAKLIVHTVSLVYWLGVLGALGYLWLFTCNQYASIGSFRVSREQTSGMDVGLAQMIIPGLSDSSASDAQLAIGYINSADLLLQLEKDFDLRNHYSQPTTDLIFRLEPDASLEDRLDYYRRHITAHFEMTSGQTMVSVKTYDPKLSRPIAEAVLKHAENFVNEVNQSVADKQMAFVRAELERAINHVDTVNQEITDLQNKHGFIDPSQAVSLADSSIQALNQQKIQKETELNTLLRDSPESPRIPALRSELRSNQELMEMEMAKLSGPEQDRLNQIIVEFRNLQQKLTLATQMRTSAEVLLEKKRIEAIASTRFFSVVQQPYLPEEEFFPRRYYATGAILVLGFLGYVILRAIIRSVVDRD